MNGEFAYNKIFHLLENEDASINLLNPKAGIFFAPELYIVFQIGRLLKTHELKVFGGETKWLRETNFGNGGPTDLIFLQEDKLFLFEFKKASTIDSYMADVEKLKKVDVEMVNQRKHFENVLSIQKYFIALTDVFSSQGKNDPRVLRMANDSKDILKPVVDFKMFSTAYDGYTRDNSCYVGLWKVI